MRKPPCEWLNLSGCRLVPKGFSMHSSFFLVPRKLPSEAEFPQNRTAGFSAHGTHKKVFAVTRLSDSLQNETSPSCEPKKRLLGLP